MIKLGIIAGIFFMPLLAGGIRVAGHRIVLFDIYFWGLFPIWLMGSALGADRKVFLRGYKPYIVMLLVGWILSMLFVYDMSTYLFGLYRNLQYLIFALIIGSEIRNERDGKLFLIAFMGLIAWNSVVGIIQTLFGIESIMIRRSLQANAILMTESGVLGRRITTSFADPIASGLFQAVGSSYLLGFIFERKNYKKDLFLSLLYGISIVSLLASGSRGPIAATLLTFVIIVAINELDKWCKKTHRDMPYIRKLILMILIASVLVFIFRESLNTLKIRLWDRSDRLSLWRLAITKISISHLLGVGIGNFPFAAHSSLAGNPIIYGVTGLERMLAVKVHAESFYITELVEIGVIGFIGLLGIIMKSLAQFFRVYREGKFEKGNVFFRSLFPAWLCLCLGFIAAHSYDLIGIALLFWVFVGFSLGLNKLLARTVVCCRGSSNRTGG